MENSAVKVTSIGMVLDWPQGFSAALPDEPWLVLHAYPRQEKKVIEDLRRRNLPGCAFFERRLRHYPGKGTQESLIPLIPGYLFVAGGRERTECRDGAHTQPVARCDSRGTRSVAVGLLGDMAASPSTPCRGPTRSRDGVGAHDTWDRHTPRARHAER